MKIKEYILCQDKNDDEGLHQINLLSCTYISEYTTICSRAHKLSTLCCASSFNPEKLKTKNNK
jgi:hypothetical protein